MTKPKCQISYDSSFGPRSSFVIRISFVSPRTWLHLDLSERFLRLHARVTELLAQHVGQGESCSFGSRTHFAEQDRGAGAVRVVSIAENSYQDGHGRFGFAPDLPQCVDRLQPEVVIL